MAQHLSVVYFTADPLSDRRSHWSLFLTPPDSIGTGTIYEAQGGLLQMTYGRMENATPAKDSTYRGQKDLCEIPEDKVQEFDKVTRETELPCSLLKVPPGYVRRDCQYWVAAVIKLAVERGVIPADTEGKLDSIPRKVLLGEAEVASTPVEQPCGETRVEES
jgi:hypothetical protein